MFKMNHLHQKLKNSYFLQQIEKLSLYKCTCALICYFLCQGYIIAQDESYIIDNGWGKYTYLNQTKKLHKFKDDFSLDPVTLDLFKKFNNPRQTQIIINTVSAGLAVGTIGLTASVADESGLAAVITIMLGAASTGVVFGVGNLLTGPRKAKAKRELIKHINLGKPTSSSVMVHDFNYATPIVYEEAYDMYTINKTANKFHLLGSEIAKDNYSTAEFENYLILRKRQKRSLLYSYIFGGTFLGFELLAQTGVIDEDTSRGDAHLFLTRYTPIVAALGSLGFSFVFSKRKNVSKERLISYINGNNMSYYKKSKQINFMGGISQHGLSLSIQF